MKKFTLLFGYNKDDYFKVKKQFDEILSFNIVDYNDAVIEEILNNIDSFHSDENFNHFDDRVIMFINFQNEDIKDYLKKYPSNIARPMFCTVTEHNVKWTFDELKSDLIKEREYFRNRN